MSKRKHGGADDFCAEANGGGTQGRHVAREYGVSKHTIYAWKAKYAEHLLAGSYWGFHIAEMGEKRVKMDISIAFGWELGING